MKPCNSGTSKSPNETMVLTRIGWLVPDKKMVLADTCEGLGVYALGGANDSLNSTALFKMETGQWRPGAR